MRMVKLNLAEFRGTHGCYVGRAISVNASAIAWLEMDASGRGYGGEGTAFTRIHFTGDGKSLEVFGSPDEVSAKLSPDESHLKESTCASTKGGNNG